MIADSEGRMVSASEERKRLRAAVAEFRRQAELNLAALNKEREDRAALQLRVGDLERELAELRSIVMRRSGASSWEEWRTHWDPTEETTLDYIIRLRALVASIHEAMGESKHSEDAGLPDFIRQLVSESRDRIEYLEMELDKSNEALLWYADHTSISYNCLADLEEKLRHVAGAVSSARLYTKRLTPHRAACETDSAKGKTNASRNPETE